MAVNDFVRRSMQIVAGGIAQSTTDYFDNAISFANDVKEVIDMGKQSASDGTKKFNELKSSGILKKARDWFYNEGGMFGDFDFDDDDFDAGFEIDSADSDNGGESTKPLSKDMMTDIAKKQTGAMYKAFGRQADLHIANTAEIISTINTRTAELTASVNNVNNTLIQIGKRLDLIVEWTAGRAKKEEEEKRTASVLDYGGGISLTGIINKSKESLEDSMLGTFMSIGKTMLGSGMMTPEMVASMIFSQTILDKKWKKLDNKSINDIGEFINDTVGEVIQNSLTKALTMASKNDMLEGFFDDILRRSSGKNYQSLVTNQYNDKPAVFDGMTRKSIVTVIPGYLNEILKAVNDGKGMNVDKKGNLTSDKQGNAFVKTVAESYFRAGSIGYKERDRMEAHFGDRLSRQDINNAIRIMTGEWMFEFYLTGRVILELGEVTDMSYDSTRRVINNSAIAMSQRDSKHRSREEWIDLYRHILLYVDEYKYRQELQRSAERADKELTTFAKTNVNNHQASVINRELMNAAHEYSFSQYNKGYETPTPDVRPTAIGSTTEPIRITEMDYLSGILKKLNTGVNVWVDWFGKPYDPVIVTPGMGKTPEKPPAKTTSTKTATTPTPAPTATPGVVATTLPSYTTAGYTDYSATDKYAGDPHYEEYKELKERVDHGETLSKDEEKELKELAKKYDPKAKSESAVKEFVGSGLKHAKNWLFGKEDLHKEYFLPPGTTDVWDLFDKIGATAKDILSTAIPGHTKETVNKAKENELYQKVVNSTTAQNVKSKASTGLNTIVGTLTPTSVLKSRAQHVLNDTANASAHDAEILQMMNTMSSAAFADGDFSNIDFQDTVSLTNQLEDKALQRKVNQTLIPLLKRNGKNLNNGGSGESKPNSTIGKLAKMGLAAVKFALTPIIGYVKVVLFGVFSLVKVTSKKLFGLLKWGMTRGLRQLKYGLKSMGQGIKGIFSPILKTISKATDGLFNMFENLRKGMSNVSEWISKKFSGGSKTEDGTDKTTGEKKGLYGTISGAKENLANKLANGPTGFMKGFTQAYRERKEAERKASKREQAEPAKIAMESVGVPDIKEKTNSIVNIITGIKDILTGKEKGIAQDVSKKLDAIEKNQEEDQAKAATSSGSASMTDLFTGDENGKGGVTKPTKTSTMPGIGSTKSTDLGGNKSAKSTSSTKGSGKSGGVLESIGQMIGGMSSSLGAIVTIVTTLAAYFEGAKLLVQTVVDILMTSLDPLNKAFQSITKALKPVLKQVGDLIKQLADFIVTIVDVVIDIIKPIMNDVIKPILEILSPLLETIIGLLTPILSLIGVMAKVILAPLLGYIKHWIVPILKIIGDGIQVIMGLFQLVGGAFMVGLGHIISAIGGLISIVGKIPLLGAAGNVGEEILETGKTMSSTGKDMFVQGGKVLGNGVINYALDVSSLLTMGASDAIFRPEEDNKKEVKVIEATDEDVVSRTYANGDLYSTYGGEYQRGMGGYLNMNQRGCGPIALADMYNRNNDSRVSARTLAGSMYGNGAYDPHRGTSVGGYIDTARSLGMNLTPGKVTQQSLKSASPTNPITVVGSGSDYGTRRGNNHFMNVIGTDSHGGAYVSNPLTGRIDRRPASTVAGSAVMGLYAGGDEADGGYTFPQAIKEAFKKLKEQAAKILGLFNMDKSDTDEINEAINAEQNKNAVEQAKRQLGDDYATYEKEAKDKARADFETKYPKKDGETDEAHEAKFEEYWNTHSAEYLAETKLMEAASAKSNDGWQAIKNTSDAFVDAYAGEDGLFNKLGDAYSNLNEQTKSLGGPSSGSSGGYGSSGYFTSDEGVPLWVPYSDNIEITDTDITKGNYHSPLFEFFAKTMGLNLGDIYGSGWFSNYQNPNKEGVGSSGGSHSGLDFTGGSILGKPLYATTGGEVIANWTPGESGGGGNTLVWKDSAGKLHWYMHMTDKSPLTVGQQFEGGEFIGYAGNTGHSTGPHLHYTINDTLAGSGSGHVYNPLMYFRNYNPNGGTIGVALGDSDEEKIFSYLVTSGMTPIGAAGLMGCFKYESDMRSNNLENSYNDQFGLNDEQYTAAVNSGQESEQQFISGRNATAWAGQTPGEAVGYGIAQFTSSNLKRDIYNKTVKQKKSIASLEPQLDAIMEVLKQRGIYDTINNAKTPTDANKTFLWKYEAGTNYSSDAAVLKAYPWMLNTTPDGTQLRHQYAEAVYNTYKNWTPTAATHGLSDSSGNIKINSAGDAKMYNALNMTGSTSGTGVGIVTTQSDALNVRKSKSTSADIIGHLPPGTQIDIEYCDSNKWLYIPSLDGYVSSDYISVISSDNKSNGTWNGGTGGNYTGSINSAADARMASIGNEGTTIYTAKNTLHGEQANDKSWAAKDPKWRAAWYNEAAPQHVTEFPDAFKDLEKMTIDVARSSSKYYDNLVDAYGGGSLGKDAVKSLYDECATAKEWENSRYNYILKSKTKRADVNQIKNMPFVEDLRAIHNAYYPNSKLSWSDMTKRVSGSGDMSELDFWNDYLGWNNAYASSNVTTPIGEDYLTDQSTYYDPETGATVVNNYAVTRGDDTVTRARIKAILANTYNVRSESMEAILEAILEELRKRKELDNGGTTDTHGSTKLFDERIPAQVRRLSIG